MTDINTITTSNSIANKNSPVVINEENYNAVKNALGSLHKTLCILESKLSPAFDQLYILNALLDKPIFDANDTSSVACLVTCSIKNGAKYLEDYVYDTKKMAAHLSESIRDLNSEIRKAEGRRAVYEQQ